MSAERVTDDMEVAATNAYLEICPSGVNTRALRAALSAADAVRDENAEDAHDASVWTLIDMAERCGAVRDEGESGLFWTIDVPQMYAIEAALQSAEVSVGYANAAWNPGEPIAVRDGSASGAVDACQLLDSIRKHVETHRKGLGGEWQDWAAEIVVDLSAAISALRQPVTAWNTGVLSCWSICGMNHYHQNGERRLFVSMTRMGRFIVAEGSDEADVFRELLEKAQKDTSHE